MEAALPCDDDGPLSQDTVVAPQLQPVPKQRSNKRKAAPLAGSRAGPEVLQEGSELPDLPDDVDGDLPMDMLEELALDGPVQGPAGRPAKVIVPQHRRRAPKFLGRSMADIMKELEMVPSRHHVLWDVQPQLLCPLDGTLPDDLVEIYSPPRMVPIAVQQYGLRATLSVDLLTGWNLLDSDVRVALVQEIKRRRPRVLMMSPPCTWFSGLMNLNWGKIKPVVREQAFRDATLHLEFCMLLADLQEAQGCGWAFEHPDSARSWHNQKVEATLQRGALLARFDQCMFGLVSKVDKTPMRKRTRFMTNIKHLKIAFNKKFCDCSHDHVTVQGSEGGERRSVWAQRYPPAMCEAAVRAFQGYRLDHTCGPNGCFC